METFGNNSLIKWLSLIAILFFSFNFSYSTQLELNIEVEEDYFVFRYDFIFQNSSAPSNVIAFEKSQDSVLTEVVDSSGVNYEPLVVGDYYRIELEDRDIKNLSITFLSKETYRSVFEDDELYFYVNSNLDLTQIDAKIDVVRSFAEVSEIFPRNYVYDEINNRLLFNIDNPGGDNLFQIKYIQNSSSMSIWILILLLIPVIFFIALFLILKANPVKKKQKDLEEYLEDSEDEANIEEIKVEKKENIKPKKVETVKTDSKELSKEIKEKEAKSENLDEKVEDSSEEVIQEDVLDNENLDNEVTELDNEPIVNENEVLEEYIQKYLTENEQDVIRTIKKNEGLIQQEILDYLPFITKSTLSKIISKLENKKILERVRVGKINKLYLGEVLKNLGEQDSLNSELEK